ncbi:Hypothetical predicted protein, partial [Olea europaea subsp. europaea]
ERAGSTPNFARSSQTLSYPFELATSVRPSTSGRSATKKVRSVVFSIPTEKGNSGKEISKMALVGKETLCLKEQARTMGNPPNRGGVKALPYQAKLHCSSKARPKQLRHKPHKIILSVETLAQKVKTEPPFVSGLNASTLLKEAKRGGTE